MSRKIYYEGQKIPKIDPVLYKAHISRKLCMNWRSQFSSDDEARNVHGNADWTVALSSTCTMTRLLFLSALLQIIFVLLSRLENAAITAVQLWFPSSGGIETESNRKRSVDNLDLESAEWASFLCQNTGVRKGLFTSCFYKVNKWQRNWCEKTAHCICVCY